MRGGCSSEVIEREQMPQPTFLRLDWTTADVALVQPCPNLASGFEPGSPAAAMTSVQLSPT